MKTNFKTIGLLLATIVVISSCNKDDNGSLPILNPPTSQEFSALRNDAMQNQTQIFNATAGIGVINLTSSHGVQITFNGNNLTKNGNPVTGAIQIKFIEVFDKGTMLVTNESTMGKMVSGDQSVLKSGGEFYIEASQGGVQLVSTGSIQLIVPASLTGAVDTGMTFWDGNIQDPENIVWERPFGGPTGQGGAVGFNSTGYNVVFGDFGWCNIDRFISDPRPKTQILATVPVGYNQTNSAIYLSVDGEGQNQLAKFDVYNPTTSQFSEHYGQIPIGLNCHIIFATEDNGLWRYAIKSVTTIANGVTAFSLSETTVGTEAQMVAAINAIQ